jgi:hypothetical protein
MKAAPQKTYGPNISSKLRCQTAKQQGNRTNLKQSRGEPQESKLHGNRKERENLLGSRAEPTPHFRE